MSKTFLVPKMSGSKRFLVENDSAPKMFWVQRNLEFKETWAEKFGSFKIIADRFLIKTNSGKILGTERFGYKKVVVAFMLKLSKKFSGFDPKILSPKQFGSRKN